jgi:hypothetical protein
MMVQKTRKAITPVITHVPVVWLYDTSPQWTLRFFAAALDPVGETIEAAALQDSEDPSTFRIHEG